MIKYKLFLLLILCLGGCMEESPTNYRIINKSDYSIEIKFFVKKQLYETITIQNSKSFCRTANNLSISPFSPGTDSIEIIFNKQRKSIQYCGGKVLYGNFGTCQYEKNLIDFLAVGEYKKGNVLINPLSTLTFDNSDYEKAVAF